MNLQTPVLAMLLANFSLIWSHPFSSSNDTTGIRTGSFFNEVIKDGIRKAMKQVTNQGQSVLMGTEGNRYQ